MELQIVRIATNVGIGATWNMQDENPDLTEAEVDARSAVALALATIYASRDSNLDLTTVIATAKEIEEGNGFASLLDDMETADNN